ncbi:MAG: hypothetical protein WCC26_13600 [Terracidiphilus sp.]
MSSSTQSVPSLGKPSRPRGDLLYQVMTIAAMLIVLVSVWVF